MHHSQKYSQSSIESTILLSIKPVYADLILAGSKTVELRRSWASKKITRIVIYSSSPIQKIVGIVNVNEVNSLNKKQLWEISKNHGGGLKRDELYSYFSGKKEGYAVFLGKVFLPKTHIDPREILENFSPPQSFRYISDLELKKFKKYFKGSSL